MVNAPGFPGIPARWTSSAKDGVGTALSPRSTVWFTLSHGTLNEIYYPCVDTACTRDLELIITDGKPGGFFAEEKRDTRSTLRRQADGVPIFNITNTCRERRFSILKQVLADPRHDCVLQKIRFIPGAGGEHLRLFVLLAPHLVNGGAHNTGWVEEYKGRKMLFASGDGTSLALACSTGFLARSVGFTGFSDGYQILHRDGELTEQYSIASLSIPWGFAKGDDDLGGYHLVWPRDLVETAGGLLAGGATASAKSVLDYLVAIQEADGHWSQNSWLDGRPIGAASRSTRPAFRSCSMTCCCAPARFYRRIAPATPA
jgi:GH15 family glucan-1,4-alpha-glucosidase